MNVFLEHLKDEMAYQNILQKELAERIGVSVNTIRGWFSKDIIPDVLLAKKIADILNVSVEYLINGDTLSKTESELVHFFRHIKPSHQPIVTTLARLLSESELIGIK